MKNQQVLYLIDTSMLGACVILITIFMSLNMVVDTDIPHSGTISVFAAFMWGVSCVWYWLLRGAIPLTHSYVWLALSSVGVFVWGIITVSFMVSFFVWHEVTVNPLTILVFLMSLRMLAHVVLLTLRDVSVARMYFHQPQ